MKIDNGYKSIQHDTNQQVKPARVIQNEMPKIEQSSVTLSGKTPPEPQRGGGIFVPPPVGGNQTYQVARGGGIFVPPPGGGDQTHQVARGGGIFVPPTTPPEDDNSNG